MTSPRIDARRRDRIVETLSHAIAVRFESRVFEKYGAGMIDDERATYERMLALGDEATEVELEMLGCDSDAFSQALSALGDEFDDAKEEARIGIEQAKRKREKSEEERGEGGGEGKRASASAGDAERCRRTTHGDDGGRARAKTSRRR